MIEDKFKEIKNLFGNLFRKESKHINNHFEELICIVYIYPPNYKTRLKNCAIGLDIVLHNTDLNKADNLCLEIYLDELANNLFMNTRIVWGHPSGKIVESIFKNPVEVTEENLDIVKKELPNLILKLRKTIQENPNGI